jgi:hypothetical protein
MCSILGIFDPRAHADLRPLRPLALSLSALQRHRGPDWSGVHAARHALLVHERLAIVDPAGGAQPIVSADGALVLAVNGEIYNHRALQDALATPYDFTTGSDCAVSRSRARIVRATQWHLRLRALGRRCTTRGDRTRPDGRVSAVLGSRCGRTPVGGFGNEGDRARMPGCRGVSAGTLFRQRERWTRAIPRPCVARSRIHAWHHRLAACAA